MPHICVFEDSQNSQLTPLVYTRATFELRCGLFTPLERIARHYPQAAITLFCRDYLSGVVQEHHPYCVNGLPAEDDTCLFINGRAMLSFPIPVEGREELGIKEGTLVYARLKGKNAKDVTPDAFLSKDYLEQLKSRVQIVDTPVSVINYYWDIIKFNKPQMEEDFKLFIRKDRISEKRYEGVYFINEDQICIGSNSLIKPCCVLDAGSGPIYIGNNVTVASNTTIEGPVSIGDHSVIQPNTRLRGGTNIGEVCKVGGEVVNTIFHSHSNKQHDGFLGDSYIGSWVNIGAGTVNSNLLNTYGYIKVEFGGEIINTQQMFLGMAMGDHTKTAINTKIMAGSNFGFACNIVTSAYPPKYLPSFSWYSDNAMKVYTLEKAFQVAKAAMKRRDREMSAREEQLFRNIFHLTEKERNFIQAQEDLYGKRYKT